MAELNAMDWVTIMYKTGGLDLSKIDPPIRKQLIEQLEERAAQSPLFKSSKKEGQ